MPWSLIVNEKLLWCLLHEDPKVFARSFVVACKNLFVLASGTIVYSIIISLIFSYCKMGRSRSTRSQSFFCSSSSYFYCFLPVLHESSIFTTGSSLSTTLPAIMSVGECFVGLISSSIFLHSFCRVTESSSILRIRCKFSCLFCSKDLYFSIICVRCSSCSRLAWSWASLINFSFLLLSLLDLTVTDYFSST